ncbi:MAG: GTPase [Woeseia sp.]
MKLDRFIRVSIGVLIALLFVIAIGALLFVTESALNVWDRLLEGPALLRYGYLAGMAALLVAAAWLVVRLLVRRKPAKRKEQASRPLTRDEIEARLRAADEAGVETGAADEELRMLAERQQTGSVHLCFFGEISTGKSSLLKALVPAADVAISAVGGSTLDIRHFRWQNDNGVEVLLTDVPGTAGIDTGLDRVAEQEARRAHVVLFVCDGDLTRAEKTALERLLALGKPLVLVLNKSDRYDAAEQALLMERLLEHVQALGGDWSRDQVVAVSAGGEQELIERSADGTETVRRRTRAADVGVLAVAINRLLQRDRETLDQRRDRAVFHLAAEKLDAAEERYRAQRSQQIIRTATRNAVIGAMAAVSPGTDVLIQGYIGTTMTRALCRLYGAQPRDLDIEEFLSLSQSRVGRTLPLTLAVAGNGLKAFPGLGTVAGGLVHAVAYGLIFDALGRSLVLTLKKHGALEPEKAASEFEDSIGEHIEEGVQQVARMALEARREQRND